MAKIFCDINIFQDVLSARSGINVSYAIIDSINYRKWQGAVAAFSVPTLWYLNRRDIGRRAKIIELLKGFEIVALTGSMIKQGLTKPKLADLEDELQFLAAKKSGARYLVTRNVKDFPVEDLKIVTPEEFILRFS